MATHPFLLITTLLPLAAIITNLTNRADIITSPHESQMSPRYYF